MRLLFHLLLYLRRWYLLQLSELVRHKSGVLLQLLLLLALLGLSLQLVLVGQLLPVFLVRLVGQSAQ
jgi:hypothetical protein